MGGLEPTSRGACVALVLALGLIGCGPTAEVLTTPTPGRASSPPQTPGVQPTTSLAPGATAAPGTTAGQTDDAAESLAPGASATPYSGQVWQALTDFPTADASEVTSVTATSDGYVAVGFGPYPGEDYFGRRQGIVWRSTDGRTWQPAVDPSLQFVTPEEIVALGDALFLFGTVETCNLSLDDGCVEPPESGWAVWRSIAGAAWERLPQLASMQTGTIDGVIVAGGALVAHGWAGEDSQATVWTSADGITWSQTADLAEIDQVTAMAELPSGGLVAFGSTYSSDLGDIELRAASSTDGVHFARIDVPALPATMIQAAVPGPGGIVAVGDGEDLDLNFNGVTLQSADGLTWTQTSASDGSFAGSALEAVHAVPSGYVAIGIEPLPDDFGVATGGSWSSTDGLSWRTLAPLGGQFSVLDASAAGATGIVAFTVTEEETDDESVTSSIAAWFAPLEALTF